MLCVCVICVALAAAYKLVYHGLQDFFPSCDDTVALFLDGVVQTKQLCSVLVLNANMTSQRPAERDLCRQRVVV
jgi:hypothetical protein